MAVNNAGALTVSAVAETASRGATLAVSNGAGPTSWRSGAKRGRVEIENDPNKRGTGKTALVVDDGFKACGEAANGREAINPDVIVLDLSMPLMNGLSAASELRKIFPDTPIILFTLYGSEVSKGRLPPRV